MDYTSATAAGAPATAQQNLNGTQNEGGGASAPDRLDQIVALIRASAAEPVTVPEPIEPATVVNLTPNVPILQKLDELLGKIPTVESVSELDELKLTCGASMNEILREAAQEIAHLKSNPPTGIYWATSYLASFAFVPKLVTLTAKLDEVGALIFNKRAELKTSVITQHGQVKFAIRNGLNNLMKNYTSEVVTVGTSRFSDEEKEVFAKHKSDWQIRLSKELPVMYLRFSEYGAKNDGYADFRAELHKFAIERAGINLVSSIGTDSMFEKINDFENFVNWVFSQEEFNLYSEEHEIKGAFRQGGAAGTINGALQAFSSFGSTEGIVEYLQEHRSEDQAENRNNSSAIIKQLCDKMILGKAPINVASLPVFSTRLLSIFLGVDSSYTYNSLSIAFPITSVIFKEISNEIGQFTEKMRENSTFNSFIESRGLEVGTDKFMIEMVKWLCFSNRLAENLYTVEERELVYTLDSTDYPSISVIQEQAKSVTLTNQSV